MIDSRSAQPSAHPGLSFGAFVAMMAGFMAMNGLAIDTMLPALPAIAQELGVSDANQRQWVISAYLLGFGSFQIVYGPISDRYGRRPALLLGATVYAVFSIATALTTVFSVMIFTRFLMGAGAAATRVLVVAIVRDCYSGRQMARVMSLSFIIFLTVPVLAPGLGQLVMLFVSWHWIYLGLAAFAIALLVWAMRRLPETLQPEHRLPLAFGRIGHAFAEVVTRRQSRGYTLAMTLLLGALFAYLNSAQQIFTDVFGVPQLFTLYFALSAVCMALASWLNARIVERLGTRRVSHTAVIGFLLFSVINLLYCILVEPSLTVFVTLFSATMFCFGLTVPNFGAMAMEPVGHIAGTASSVQGCVTTVGAALLGVLIGQQYDGSVVPLLGGYCALSLVALGIVWWTENGRLFAPTHEPHPSA